MRLSQENLSQKQYKSPFFILDILDVLLKQQNKCIYFVNICYVFILLYVIFFVCFSFLPSLAQIPGGVQGSELWFITTPSDGYLHGKSLTKYSFFDSNNKVVVGAQIDMSDKSGQNFFDKDIVESKINIINYMPNATGGKKYDFKTIGINSRGNKSRAQYSYRGMPFTDENGNKFIASARDIGNYSAGYMAGISGQGWDASRTAFDALESVQMGKVSTEAMVSQTAEKAGFDRGNKNIGNSSMKCKGSYKKDEFILGM